MLEFDFDEFVAEGRLFLSLSKPFIARSQGDKIVTALTELQSYRYSANRHPLVFRAEAVETYQVQVPVAQGAEVETIYARITIAWPIEKTSAMPTRRFFPVNEAVTQVDLVRLQDPKLLRSWRARLSASSSMSPRPLNCLLSTTFDSYQPDADDNVPSAREQLDIPFIPTLPISPFAVAEFALAELWPEAWNSATSRGPDAQRWRLIQRKRLERYLSWMATQARVSPISPWMAIRGSRPPASFFVG